MHQLLEVDRSFAEISTIGQALVEQLNALPIAEKNLVLPLLVSGYEGIREQFLTSCLDTIRPMLGEQYSKLILFENQTQFGRLAVDWIQFGFHQPTGLHLHSDFVFEELFSGSTEEQIYQRCAETHEYVPVSTEVRNSPCSRFGYDPTGHPHCVTALEPKTWGLCLHLGKRGVVFVSSNSPEVS